MPSLMKLNPSIFPVDAKKDGLYGELGYAGLMKDIRFEVIKEIEDKNRRHLSVCKVWFHKDLFAKHNVKVAYVEGEIYIVTKDLISENDL